MRILAVDYGTRRIGLAICDPLGILASPLRTLESGDLERVLASLEQIIREERVERVLFGLPKQRDGSYGQVGKAVLALATALQARIPIPVTWMDEAYTSAEAESRLKSMGGKRRTPQEERKILDQVAATLLLEEYLLCVPEHPVPLPVRPPA